MVTIHDVRVITEIPCRQRFVVHQERKTMDVVQPLPMTVAFLDRFATSFEVDEALHGSGEPSSHLTIVKGPWSSNRIVGHLDEVVDRNGCQ
mgnify:CR=1 FL=1